MARAWLAKLARLPSRADGRRCFHQSGQAGVPHRLRVAEIVQQQSSVDADIEIEDPGAELLHADKAGSCIFGLVTRLEIVDGGVVVVLRDRPMGGDRVCYLNGGFAVELRIVGEHTSEHGDVGGRIRPAQQIVGIHVLDVLSSQCAVGKGQSVRSLFGGYEGQLLDEGGLLVLFLADFPNTLAISRAVSRA